MIEINGIPNYEAMMSHFDNSEDNLASTIVHSLIIDTPMHTKGSIVYLQRIADKVDQHENSMAAIALYELLNLIYTAYSGQINEYIEVYERSIDNNHGDVTNADSFNDNLIYAPVETYIPVHATMIWVGYVFYVS